MALISEGRWFTSEHVCFPSKHVSIPSEHVCIPSKHVCSPSEHVSILSEHVCSPSKHVSIPSEHVSFLSEHVPTPTEHVGANYQFIPSLEPMFKMTTLPTPRPAWSYFLRTVAVRWPASVKFSVGPPVRFFIGAVCNRGLKNVGVLACAGRSKGPQAGRGQAHRITLFSNPQSIRSDTCLYRFSITKANKEPPTHLQRHPSPQESLSGLKDVRAGERSVWPHSG
jgi:hypothetical protein